MNQDNCLISMDTSLREDDVISLEEVEKMILTIKTEVISVQHTSNGIRSVCFLGAIRCLKSGKVSNIQKKGIENTTPTIVELE